MMEAPTIIQALVVGNVDGEKGVLNKEVLKGVKMWERKGKRKICW